jgi:hypothetical protein
LLLAKIGLYALGVSGGGRVEWPGLQRSRAGINISGEDGHNKKERTNGKTLNKSGETDFKHWKSHRNERLKALQWF